MMFHLPLPNQFPAPEGYQIRPAGEGDVPEIHRLVTALAEYEKLTHELVSKPGDFAKALFGDQPVAGALAAEESDPSHAGHLVGFALFFHTFSTFVGKPGIYLEDVFVEPDHRGAGLGKFLLRGVAQIGEIRDCGRMDWCVLDWNTPAIEFYESMGAELKREWVLTRLDRKGLESLNRS